MKKLRDNIIKLKQNRLLDILDLQTKVIRFYFQSYIDTEYERNNNEGKDKYIGMIKQELLNKDVLNLMRLIDYFTYGDNLYLIFPKTNSEIQPCYLRIRRKSFKRM